MTKKLVQLSNTHSPFIFRIIIVAISAICGVLAAFSWEDPLSGLAVYFCSATFLDYLIHNGLELKASNYSDPKLLLEKQHVNGKELDQYFESRKKIRIISLSLAIVAYGVGEKVLNLGLEAFCLAYPLSTLVGIFYVRKMSEIRRPRLIFRDDSYYDPETERPFYYLDLLNWYMGRGPMP
jgi:hypothetical protein